MRFVYALALPLLLVACAQPQKKSPGSSVAAPAKSPHVGKTINVRTTAYSHLEAGGHRNAIGTRLSNGAVKSAASDWSQFPVGTKFKIVKTGEIRIIDDYGSALVGNATIDLYKPSMKTMRAWGVRHIDIQILEWGSPRRSLEILSPRSRNRHVAKMVASLRQQSSGIPKKSELKKRKS